MQFKSHIGVYDFEQQYGNNFEVDVEIDSSMVNGHSDQLSDTLDYALIYQVVADIMGRQGQLIEHACKQIVDSLCAQKLSGEALVVRVFKLHPPLGSEVRSVGIELHWNKKANSTV